MHSKTSKLLLATTLGLALTGVVRAQETESLDVQSEFPRILRQPEDQLVRLGSPAVFEVVAENADAYQWVRNEVILLGQTNSTLVLGKTAISDVALYYCYVFKAEEAIPTRSALLNVYTSSTSSTSAMRTSGSGGMMLMSGGGGSITVFGAPVTSGGSQGSCPGSFIGYVMYCKSVAQGWGWTPTAGTTVHTATDLNRTDTKVQFIGKWGDIGCNQTTVAVPDPTFSPKYRFGIYFTNNVPTNAYPITMEGFDP